MAEGNKAPWRLSELNITGYRSFGQRVTIPLGRESVGEPWVVFQGENGVGKSSVLSALELFFRGVIVCLAAGASGSSDAELTARWDLIASVGHRDLLVRRRDRPAGFEGATVLEGRFGDPALGVLRVSVEPRGEEAHVKLLHSARGQQFFEPDRSACEALLRRIEAPLGEGSRPLAAMTARRRAVWLPEDTSNGVVPAGLLVQLFRLRTSLDPSERRRWRSFVEALKRFDTFAAREVSVERLDAGPPQLLVEEFGRLVVPLAELGAGEQQVVALVAALVLGRGAVLAIEKPELCLDTRHQRALVELLESHVRGETGGQILIESNAPGFARGLQVRFLRAPAGDVTIERVDGAPAARREAVARV
ncbi:MAG: ATP-binding protein [Polyangiaceae bacterium]|nr:ATP-binding protein [Polyangiaceae bacterium]